MNFIKQIEISNFKSIKNLPIKNCKRINLLVGTPNAGKSNLLEAMSLFMKVNSLVTTDFTLKYQIRLNNATELYNYGNIKNDSRIYLNSNEALHISYLNDNSLTLHYLFGESNKSFSKTIGITSSGQGTFPTFASGLEVADKIYFYKFDSKTDLQNKTDANRLNPIYGDNLFWVLENNNHIKEYFFDLIKDFGLKFYNQQPQNSIILFKELSEFNIFPFSFSLIPDTIQRLLFYHTSIETNQNSILLFEEPEAHMFPPYISKFTGDIIKNDTNQYFIATHSPYVIDDFLAESMENLAVHLLYFEDGETKAYTLTAENLDTLYQNGSSSIFLNLDRFRKNEN